MIQETIARLEAQLRQPEGLKEEERDELLRLLTELRGEVEQLARTHSEQAESIVGFAAVSTHEAIRTHRDAQLLDLSVEGLAASVQGFEQSHPRLVQVVNSICNTLSNLGI